MDETTQNVSFVMSAEINEISAALSSFQGEIIQPTLNKTNTYFHSRYVDLTGVLKSVQGCLSKNGLCVTQLVVGDALMTILSHKSGQWFRSLFPLTGQYKNQQERGSAITYSKRYALCAMLGISADEDDDGNSAAEADEKAHKALLQEAADKISKAADINELTSIYNAYKGAPIQMEIHKMCSAKKKEILNATKTTA